MQTFEAVFLDVSKLVAADTRRAAFARRLKQLVEAYRLKQLVEAYKVG